MSPTRNILTRWWVIPACYIAGMALIYMSFLTIGPNQFEFLFGTKKFVSDAALIYAAGFVCCLAVCFAIAARVSFFRSDNTLESPGYELSTRTLEIIILLLTILFIIGHGCLFYVGRSMFSGFRNLIETKSELVLTGSGLPIFLIYVTPLFAGALGLRIFSPFRERCPKWVYFVAASAFFVIAVRGMLFERLAIFELIIPPAWFFLRRLRTRTVFLLGIGSSLAAISIFAVAEYFRSFQIVVSQGLYRDNAADFIEYVFNTISGYYVTPANYQSALEAQGFLGKTDGYYTYRIFTNTPVIGGFLRDNFSTFASTAAHADFYNEILDPKYGLNPSYNLFGLIGFSLLDWGWAGLWIAVLYGVIGGTLWNYSRKGITIATLGFPIVLIGLMESPRIQYLSNERVFFSYFFLLLVGLLVTRITRPALVNYDV